MTRAKLNKAEIVAGAWALASERGLEGLTIGVLAERLGYSKSGLFAHFGSKEELQLAVLQLAQQRFVSDVIRPALKEAQGLPRVLALLQGWLAWIDSGAQPSGCVLYAGAAEFDARPGPVRDCLAGGQREWRATLEKAICMAQEAGHLRSEIPAATVAMALFGLAFAAHHDRYLLEDKTACQRAFSAVYAVLTAFG